MYRYHDTAYPPGPRESQCMIGPVLSFELLRTSRRGWHHYLLWIYAGWLAFLLGVVLLLEIAQPLPHNPYGRMPAETFAAYCRTVVELLIGQQFVILLLVTPAFAAGSISDEKTRGTLQEWLTTDLTAWEILRGKLLAQVTQLGTLALAALPPLAFFGVFAGMTLPALALLLWTVLVQLVALSSA